jgi:hypothetical protein
MSSESSGDEIPKITMVSCRSVLLHNQWYRNVGTHNAKISITNLFIGFLQLQMLPGLGLTIIPRRAFYECSTKALADLYSCLSTTWENRSILAYTTP